MKRRYVSGLAGLVGLVLGVAILTLGAAPAAATDVPAARTLARAPAWGRSRTPAFALSSGSCEQHHFATGSGRGRWALRSGDGGSGAKLSTEDCGLPVDGVAGPETHKLLRVVCRGERCVNGARKTGNHPRARGTAETRRPDRKLFAQGRLRDAP